MPKWAFVHKKCGTIVKVVNWSEYGRDYYCETCDAYIDGKNPNSIESVRLDESNHIINKD